MRYLTIGAVLRPYDEPPLTRTSRDTHGRNAFNAAPTPSVPSANRVGLLFFRPLQKSDVGPPIRHFLAVASKQYDIRPPRRFVPVVLGVGGRRLVSRFGGKLGSILNKRELPDNPAGSVQAKETLIFVQRCAFLLLMPFSYHWLITAAKSQLAAERKLTRPFPAVFRCCA